MGTDWEWLRADYAAYLRQIADMRDPEAGIIGLPFGSWLRAQPTAYLVYHGLEYREIEHLEVDTAGDLDDGRQIHFRQ